MKAITADQGARCAGLCTEQDLVAAHAIHHARLLAGARRIVVDPGLAEDKP